MKLRTLALAAGLVISSPVWATTVVTETGAVTSLKNRLSDPVDLWVTTHDLPSVNGFELKPEGACLDEICVPVQRETDTAIYIERSGVEWLNVSELARRIQQPVVTDYDQDVWSFGAIPAQRSAFVRDGRAPDFTLQDVDGEQLSLSDFKGKKIMLLSWASW